MTMQSFVLATKQREQTQFILLTQNYSLSDC